jgi:hypothetical protein
LPLWVDDRVRARGLPLAMVDPMPLMPSSVKIEPDRSTKLPVCSRSSVIRAATDSEKASVWNVERLPFPCGPAETCAGFSARRKDPNEWSGFRSANAIQQYRMRTSATTAPMLNQ